MQSGYHNPLALSPPQMSTTLQNIKAKAEALRQEMAGYQANRAELARLEERQTAVARGNLGYDPEEPELNRKVLSLRSKIDNQYGSESRTRNELHSLDAILNHASNSKAAQAAMAETAKAMEAAMAKREAAAATVNHLQAVVRAESDKLETAKQQAGAAVLEAVKSGHDAGNVPRPDATALTVAQQALALAQTELDQADSALNAAHAAHQESEQMELAARTGKTMLDLMTAEDAFVKALAAHHRAHRAAYGVRFQPDETAYRAALHLAHAEIYGGEE